MSKSTRCRLCGHTPGEWDDRERKDKKCPQGCVCHDGRPIEQSYRPTPPTRPGWPRANPVRTMPLVIRRYPVHPRGETYWSYQDKGTGREYNPFAPVKK